MSDPFLISNGNAGSVQLVFLREGLGVSSQGTTVGSDNISRVTTKE